MSWWGDMNIQTIAVMYQDLCSTLHIDYPIYFYKVGIALAPILQVGKLRPKESRQCALVAMC